MRTEQEIEAEDAKIADINERVLAFEDLYRVEFTKANGDHRTMLCSKFLKQKVYEEKRLIEEAKDDSERNKPRRSLPIHLLLVQTETKPGVWEARSVNLRTVHYLAEGDGTVDLGCKEYV